MELELKHLAAYLPYGLKIQGQTHGEIQEMTGLNSGVVMINHNAKGWADFFDIKPILRPLSDLNDDETNTTEYLQSCCYSYVQYLLEQHYDVFGLIENDLAIDINTLENGK